MESEPVDGMNARTDGAPTGESTPPYVHCLLDSLLRHQPIDFQGQRIPDDVRERLEAYFADREHKADQLAITDNNALANLNGLLSAAMAIEFAALGAALSANDDFSWMRTSLGVLAKMRVRQVAWTLKQSSRAVLSVPAEQFPEPPDDRQWVPVFAFGE